MPYLTVAVVLLTVICLLHMVVTLGLVRRIRTLSDIPGNASVNLPPSLPPGRTPAEFSFHLDDGSHVDRAFLNGGRTLIGFFSVTCVPCRSHAPAFGEYADAFGAQRAFAVVQGDTTDGAKFAAELLPGVAVLLEKETDSPVAKAFDVAAFPTFYILDADGRVEHATFSLDRLPAPTTSASASEPEVVAAPAATTTASAITDAAKPADLVGRSVGR